MTTRKPKIEGVSCVLIGKFSPGMFHPEWFRRYNLMRADEIENAKVAVVHSSLALFKAGALDFKIDENRFIVETAHGGLFEVLRDLVVSTFILLEATPVTRLGVNYKAHFPTLSRESWNAFGDILAPKESWKNVLENPGMKSLTLQGKNPRDEKGYIQVKVEPSAAVDLGIFIDVNNHFEWVNARDSSLCVSLLKEEFSKIVDESRKRVSALIEIEGTK